MPLPPIWFLPSGFPAKLAHAFVIFAMFAACLILHDLFTLIVFGEDYYKL